MVAILLEPYSLLGLAARSFLLLIIAAGVAFAFRHRSAAVLHGIWTVGLAACLMTPLAMFLSPSWSIPLLRPPTTTAWLRSELRNERPPFLSPSPESTGVVGDRPMVSEAVSATGTESGSHAETSPAPTATFIAASSDSAIVLPPSVIPLVATTIWAVGLVAVLSRLVRQAVQVRHKLRDACDLNSPEWCERRDLAAEQLGLRVRVAMKQHAGAISPMVIGLFRPIVQLPDDIDGWSNERRLQVLLHELAHVQRCDILTQVMASLTCAVYWFNPLAWWGAAQMRQLREIACDDAVVTHCRVPASYAKTLLDVAKRYRSQSLAGSVAMARSNNVYGRISAILSSTRSRDTLGKRSVRALGAMGLIVALVVGTCQLTSRAQVAVESNTDEASAEATNTGPQIMRVRIVDEAGSPLPDARLHVSIWDIEGAKKKYPNRNYTTDDQGVAKVERPHRLEIMRMWPAKQGYVPQFVNFTQGSHKQGLLVPDEYEFRLQKGSKLGGRIVDEEGQPIEGATVQVLVNVNEPAWGVKPSAMISTWLTDSDFNCPIPVTDSEGRWSIDNAPPPSDKGEKDAYEFQLQVTHPNFAGDTQWGELQRQQGITTADLRFGESKFVLGRGIAIAGVVSGPKGESVSKGLVVWNDRPYTAIGVNETQIDDEGRFETKHLAPGEYPITVLAPGFAPMRQLVDVNQDLGELNLQLEVKNSIIIKIVDRDGKGIPQAHVGIGEWRGTEAIFNQKHPNVLDSGVPRQADDQGVYQWNWAPADAVTYRIGAKGYAPQEVVLVAKSTPHVVTLSGQREVVGTVSDAATGKPIDSFEVMPVIVFEVMPVIVFGPDFYHTRTTDAKTGQAGKYELFLTGSADPTDRYRVRFEADGYRSVVSDESFGPEDGRAILDMTLQPAPSRRGQVVDAAGNPVENATVLQATPTETPDTKNGEPSSYGTRGIQTDASGQFALRATTESVRIRAYHQLGYAEKTLAPEDKEAGTITLASWGTLSGRLVQANRPIVDESIYFYPIIRYTLSEPRFQDSFYVKTDADGYFQFDRIPPISGTVKAYLGPWQDSQLTSSESIPLRLQAGERREVLLGSEGAMIQGRVVATGRSNDALNKQWSLNYLVSRDRGIDYPAKATSLGFEPTGPIQSNWLRVPSFATWMSTRQHYFVKLSDKGTFNIHGVAPGRYDLVIQLYEEPSGCLVETIGEKVLPVTVSAEQVAAGRIDIGDIDVKCRIGPRVGSDMRAFRLTDVSGRVRNVNDLQGQFVLLHVWATWCAPCVESMPELRATVEQYSETPLTVVGLNVDKDTAAAKSMASDQRLDWAQNYLGGDSETMRQLAVSSVPAYYLIGPNGKLVGSANQWRTIKQLLSDKVK